MNHHVPTVLRRRTLLLAMAAAPAATLAQAKGEILVGRTAALSGGMAPFMNPVHEGHDAAIADLNAQGGIGGRPVRLVTLDDGFDAKRALENARTLVEKEGVVALFGTAGTSQVMTLLPYLAQAKLPLIGVYTGSPTVRMQGSPYLFTTSASYADELVKIVRNLVSIQSSRIAVAYESNDFGKLLLPLAEKVIAAEKATLAGSQMMDSSGKDAEAAAKALGALKPQAVLMIAAGPPVVAYVRAHKAQFGGGVPVYTLSLGAGTAVLKALGDDARGLAVARTTPSPNKPTLALTRDFQASMKRHNKFIDYDHFVGYMDARVLIEGLKAAGPGVTRASLTQAMEGLNRLDVGGFTYQFSAQNRNGSNYVDIAVVGAGGAYRQ